MLNLNEFQKSFNDFNNKHGIQNGITWTTNDFWQNKGLELELHGLQ
jgi:hypothetical protein